MLKKLFLLAVILLVILGVFATIIAPENRTGKQSKQDEKVTSAVAGVAPAVNPGSPAPAPSVAGSKQQAASPGTMPAQQAAAQSIAAPQASSVSAAPVNSAPRASSGRAAAASDAPPNRAAIAAQIAGAGTTAGVLQNADLSQPEIRALAVARIAEIQEAQHEAAYEKAARLGIPTRILGPGRKVSILYDFRGDTPLYRTTLNANAAISSGANLLRDQGAPYGLDGTGMKVAVWDEAKIRNTHQEFPNNRVTIKDSAADFSDHSTHVGGTIGASGTSANAKGMAPKVAIDSYDWDSDYAEMTAVGAATASESGTIPVSNHSYGYDAATADMGRYETEANTIDTLAAGLPYYLVFWAAGNEQDTLTAKGGYQSITFTGLAKNVITIGAGDDAVSGGARSPAAGTLAYFSSEGPCDDGRIKPDITANGVNVYSSVSTSNTAYDGTYSGTSMATPNAVGSAILLEQLYAREFSGQRLRASMLKALLIETADDVGRPGPDYQYGWGYINVKAAADLILAHKASLASPKLIEGTITTAAKTKTHTFAWDGTNPIRATLCWTDPAGVAQTAADSRTPNLIHDLNLKITAPDGSTTSLPYVMPFVGKWTTASMSENATTGVNKVDNVEQVYIASPPQAGSYTITVTLNGSLTTTNQIYSLVVAGGTSIESNPPPVVTLDAPSDGTVLLPNASVTLSATATDKVIGGGNGIVSSVQFFSGTTLLGTDTTSPYSLSWTPQAAGSYDLSAVATDTEGASTTSVVTTITVLSGDGAPSISSFSPSGGTSGDSITITGANFASVSSVKINGVEAGFTVGSPTSITATVPAIATTGKITVTTAYGTATSAGEFSVIQSPVLISQIYGAGGGTGATYNADYVELYNRGPATVSLSGWSIQYASAAGTSWQTVALAGSIAPGKHYLVKLSGGAIGATLPTADATGSLSMSRSSGKVALRNATTAFAGSSPVGQGGLQDFVGFGASNAYEGSAAAPSPSATTAIFRAGGGATDAGNNSADFSAAAPNPRNSSSGSVSAPAITSATSATGVLGQSFSYQISASNSPTSFGATGLPAGLSVNTSSGVISGTPTAAGTSNVAISATNSAGTGNAQLSISVTSGGGGPATTILSEDFSSITSGDNVTTTGSGTPWTGNTNFSTVSSAWQAGGVVKLGSSSAIGSMTSRILDLSANGGAFTVSFKVKGWTTVEGGIKVTVTGLTAQTVTYTALMGGSFETKSLSFTGGTTNSTVKIETTAKRAFIDDVVVTSAGAVPIISASGTLSPVDTTYGAASPTPSTFTVSGGNMTAAVLVTAPPGFELSQTSGGAAGYATTQTVGAAGTISPATIYVRLAANAAADSYAGNVVCSSSGASSVSVPVATSTVRTKTLIISAQDRTKAFGSTLALGTSAFTPTGLVPGESIGSVTLAASGGTAAFDAIGIYGITASNADGGTFAASNYDISYELGVLTVTGQNFSSWMNGKYAGQDALPGADPEGDGVSNLVEFFMGLDPANTDAPGTTSINHAIDQLSFTYRKSKSATGTTGAVKWKHDLSSATAWSSAGVTDVLVSDEGAYEIRRASVTLGSGEDKKFLRLEVTTP